MPRLPSARDVSNISPRIASDPGVSVPAQAFESPIGTLAQEFAPALERLGQVARKQENRDNAVHSSGEELSFGRDGELELLRLNKEADLTDKKTLTSLGQFLSERKSASIERHTDQGGSRDSIARLTIRLNEEEAKIIGRASAISAQLGHDKVKNAFGNALTPLIDRVSMDPSLETINEAVLKIEDRLTGLPLDPSEEETFRQTAREQVALAAVNTLITRGHIETAESLLVDGGVSQMLTADKQRQVRSNIETAKASRDKLLREIKQLDAFLIERRGTPLTPEELQTKLGLATKPPGTKSVFNKSTGELQFATDEQILADPNLVPAEVGKPADEKITQAQRLAAGFAARIEASNQTIDEVGAQFTGLSSRAGERLPQGLKSEDRQRFEQAERNFINSVLRRESGAAIAPSEFESAEIQYFPRPGDSPEVLEQKKQNRITVQKSLELEAGLAFRQLKAEIPEMVTIGGKSLLVGSIITNAKDQKGRVEANGTITILE